MTFAFIIHRFGAIVFKTGLFIYLINLYIKYYRSTEFPILPGAVYSLAELEDIDPTNK
jgi:hypothetical protein